jgi:hypothetical protein
MFGMDQKTLKLMGRAQNFSEMGILAGESEFKVCLDTLKALGVPHDVHHAPCAGKGGLGKDEAIQQAVIDFGHNVTIHATTGIQIGNEVLVFFTGGSGDHNDDGAFMFRYNVATRTVVHNTKGRKIVAKEE